MTGRVSSVEVLDGQAVVHMDEETRAFPLVSLPHQLLDWFLQGRKAGYESLAKGRGPGALFSRHLPVISTMGEDGSFPARLAHKGVGFLPKKEFLEDHILRLEEVLVQTEDIAPARSLRLRLDSAAQLVNEPESIDPRLLGSLEIFAGGTYDNLTRRPLASLLFTDFGSGYRSYQLDCAVEIIEPPDRRFRFLQLARGLFEKDPFHVTQPGVHCAYIFWIVEIHDKTPYPVDGKSVPHKL